MAALLESGDEVAFRRNVEAGSGWYERSLRHRNQ
jgi:hypothetical protein